MRHLRRVVLVALAAMAVSSVAAASASADTLSATCSWGNQSQPCDGEWYPSAVTVVWSASPAPISVAGCELGIAYQYNTDASTTLSCRATWSGGASSTYSFPFNVETSTPTAAATLARGPDSNGWYNHPVGIAFAGASFSHIASCTPATTFAGPNMMNAVVSGSCTDNAGKTAYAGVSLNYDDAPPWLAASAKAGDEHVRLSLQSSNVTSLMIWRSPGTHGAADSVVDAGGTGAFNDERVKNGVTYMYTITARDQAGYVIVRTLRATPGVRLLSPAVGAIVTSPPRLAWTSVLHARYYNVQLYRGTRKLLSAWPGKAGLGLARSWNFAGHHFRLKPGRYHWYVWPGFGRRASARYGRLIGTGAFVVARAP